MRSCNLFVESNAPGAVNASVHVGDDQRTDVFILDGSFELVVSSLLKSIVVTVVLKVAFSSLIANGAVERMIS